MNLRSPRLYAHVCCAGLLVSAVAQAAAPLGVFGAWAAFDDRARGRCYAISRMERWVRPGQPVGYASVGSVPARGLRAQPHFRLSRDKRPGSAAILPVDGRPFELVAAARDARARDRRAERAIVAAMRGGTRMRVVSYATNGRRFVDSYTLRGAATAIDAATVACARR